MADAFTDLCVLACQQRWCSLIHCGTCGHGVFRWAFRALAQGKRPAANDWTVSWGQGVTFTALEELNGPMPSSSPWSLNEQRALQRIVAQADVSRIAALCNFPEWMRYIGLALYYTEDAEAQEPLLTRSLAPQLAGLVDAGSSAGELLAGLVRASAKRRLTWTNLGVVATGIRVGK